ncbi:MAG: hypothetical protein KDD56_01820 [Bdellovibrionales bacterium]|nr:hypothetical protein [Bdellovibrionales bacterium]
MTPITLDPPSTDKITQLLQIKADDSRERHRQEQTSRDFTWHKREARKIFQFLNNFLNTDRGIALKELLASNNQWIQIGNFNYALFGSKRFLVAITGDGLKLRYSKIDRKSEDGANWDRGHKFKNLDKSSKLIPLSMQDIDISMIKRHIASVLTAILNDKPHDFLLAEDASTSYQNKYFGID